MSIQEIRNGHSYRRRIDEIVLPNLNQQIQKFVTTATSSEPTRKNVVDAWRSFVKIEKGYWQVQGIKTFPHSQEVVIGLTSNVYPDTQLFKAGLTIFRLIVGSPEEQMQRLTSITQQTQRMTPDEKLKFNHFCSVMVQIADQRLQEVSYQKIRLYGGYLSPSAA